MKRIALISEHASPLASPGGIDSGGQNVYVANVAAELARRGWQVDVFTRRDSSALPVIQEWKPGLRVINVPAGPAESIPKETLLQHMPAFTAFTRRFTAKSQRPYDLVHANFWMSGITAMDLKATLGIPFCITFHALGKVRRIHQGHRDLFPDERFDIEERIVAEADLLIAECPQDRQDLQSLYGADDGKIVVVPCGFDPDELWPVNRAQARRRLGIRGRQRILLVLGRMAPRKGVDNAIRGFARLLKSHGMPGTLMIVGGDSEKIEGDACPAEIRRLKKVADEEGVTPHVVFTGRRSREELKYYYSAADVFITTPVYEPFGITPLEAMACRLPVVASEVGGLKFTVRDGETGCLVPPNDPDGLAQSLAGLFRKNGLRQVYARAGRRRVMKHFLWSRIVESLDGFYQRIIVRGGRETTPGEYCSRVSRSEPELLTTRP